MPNDKIVKKKTISYAGERWKAFKYSLTSRYLFDGETIDKSPMETYDFIDEDIWQEFIRTRAEPSFLVSLIYYVVLVSSFILVLPNESMCCLYRRKD